MADDDDEKKAAQQKAKQIAAQEEVNKAAAPPGSAADAPSVSAPVTPPVVPAAVPNPLTAGSTFDTSGAPTPSNPGVMRPVDMAANRYRDIATTGTPQEKAQALADYKATIQYNPSVAERYDPQKWADFNQAQYAKYTSLGPDKWLDNPFTIGSGKAQLPVTSNLAEAEQLGRQGIAATPIRQEAASRALADQNVRAYHQAMQDAHNLERNTYDLHGRLEKPKDSDLAAAALLRNRALQEGLSSGVIDPEHIAADPNIDRARAVALATSRLAKDPSTLTAISSAAAPGADLAALVKSAAENRKANEESWLQNRRPIAYNLPTPVDYNL